MPRIIKGHIEPYILQAHHTADSIMDSYAANAAAVKAKEVAEQREREIREWKPVVGKVLLAVVVLGTALGVIACLLQGG